MIADVRARDYVVEVTQLDVEPGRSVTISCSDNDTSPCTKPFELEAGGETIPISVLVAISPGNAYLKFRFGDIDLLVGDQPYLHVAVGRVPSSAIRFELATPTAESRADAPNQLHRRPVLRRPSTVFANLEVNIRPAQ